VVSGIESFARMWAWLNYDARWAGDLNMRMYFIVFKSQGPKTTRYR